MPCCPNHHGKSGKYYKNLQKTTNFLVHCNQCGSKWNIKRIKMKLICGSVRVGWFRQVFTWYLWLWLDTSNSGCCLLLSIVACVGKKQQFWHWLDVHEFGSTMTSLYPKPYLVGYNYSHWGCCLRLLLLAPFCFQHIALVVIATFSFNPPKQKRLFFGCSTLIHSFHFIVPRYHTSNRGQKNAE